MSIILGRSCLKSIWSSNARFSKIPFICPIKTAVTIDPKRASIQSNVLTSAHLLYMIYRHRPDTNIPIIPLSCPFSKHCKWVSCSISFLEDACGVGLSPPTLTRDWACSKVITESHGGCEIGLSSAFSEEEVDLHGHDLGDAHCVDLFRHGPLCQTLQLEMF